MKAIIYQEYGNPEVLQLVEVATPKPYAKEVLIKIHSTTVTAVDYIMRQGKNFGARLASGLFRPKNPILGTELAGEIVSVGNAVTKFKVGDKVLAASGPEEGGYAEYKCMSEDGTIVLKPGNMSFAEAGALPYGALTALPFLRDNAKIKKGDKILIIGASGSVGTFAVQLAKYYGAVVTGLCSGANAEWVRELGADQVIDYTKEDFAKNGQTYDIIFDTVGKVTFAQAKNSLRQNGIYLTAYLYGNILPLMLWTKVFGKKKAVIAFTGLRSVADKVKDLEFLTQLIEAGKLKTVIDRKYPMDRVAEAHAYVEKGHKKGNVVLEVLT